jgi:hypothetical protein
VSGGEDDTRSVQISAGSSSRDSPGDSLNPVIGGSATLHLGLTSSRPRGHARLGFNLPQGLVQRRNLTTNGHPSNPGSGVQTRAFAGSLTYLPISTNSRTFRRNSVKFSRKRPSAYRAIILSNRATS